MRTIRKRLSPAVARHRATSQGFIIPLGLIAMLAMIGGVMMEISRLNYALVASIRTSEARKAMDAAEFGLGAILDDLNTNSNSYLLATKFTNPNGTGTWQSVTGAQLAACGLWPPTPAPTANRIPGVSTNSSSSSVALPSDQNVTYSMVSFEPPPECHHSVQRLRHVRQPLRRAGTHHGARHREPGRGGESPLRCGPL